MVPRKVMAKKAVTRVHDSKVDVRIPKKLSRALEDERRRMSAEIGTELKTSTVVRALLERALPEARA